ncbi:MAG: transcriptional regulator NrdR [Bacillota bacterium]
MRCPLCGRPDSRVLDSRPVQEQRVIRRRRECEACGNRFTTYEKTEERPLLVVKRDGRREAFDPLKIVAGLLRACEKRPVSAADMENLAAEVEREIRRLGDEEVSSETIGELVMEKLRKLDEVAYVRFASVYRQFTDLEAFRREVDRLRRREADRLRRD